MSLQSIKILPTKSSSDQQWLSWYLDVKNQLGTKKANRLFTMLWNNEDGYNSDANTNYLREEMEGYGVEIGTGIIGEVVDFASGVKGLFWWFLYRRKVDWICSCRYCCYFCRRFIITNSFQAICKTRSC